MTNIYDKTIGKRIHRFNDDKGTKGLLFTEQDRYSEIIKVDYTELLNCNISVSFAYVVAFCVKYIMNRLAHKIVKKKKEKRVGEEYVHYSTNGVTVYVVSFLSEPVRVSS